MDTPPSDADGPLLAGDLIDDVPIKGFTFQPSGGIVSRDDDHVLFASDADGDRPPWRPVSAVTGALPGEGCRVRAEWVKPAADVTPGFPDAVDRMMRDPDRGWAGITEALLPTRRQPDRTDVWLVGGAVRDLLLGTADDLVNDIDLAGTTPVGYFAEQADQACLGAGKGDLRTKVVAGVVSIRRGRLGDPPMIDYRPLHQDGFRFPASGSDLRADVTRRDLTVNCLFYDRRTRTIVDPTGAGLADLLGGDQPVLAAVDGPKDPADRADVLLRAVRMLIRWPLLPATQCRVGRQVAVDPATLREIRRRSDRHLTGAGSGQIWDAVIRLAGDDLGLRDLLLEALDA
ncbi:hypothetical protein ACTOB_003525 [Actinoplanes oblitus]|uniref:Poly A polymerase head domain-containing protein n=1 Tax=Actinoplanes oblitus TaxID=3040509 RepID=A0ABY8WPM8_9ACTN|nr:hypothetical protein [Actinoplanes oblitus]WIM99859.1 hypothetical protein ACTOB_003525 [Actinoplanes oblitus]